MHRDTCMVIVTQLSPAHRCSCHNSQHNSTIQFVQLKAVFKIPRIPIGIWLVRLKSLACATGRKRYVTPWDIAQTERRQRSRRSTKASAIPYNNQSFDTNCSQLHQKAVLSCLCPLHERRTCLHSKWLAYAPASLILQAPNRRVLRSSRNRCACTKEA